MLRQQIGIGRPGIAEFDLTSGAKVIHFAAIDQAHARAARIVVIEAVPGAQYSVNAAVGGAAVQAAEPEGIVRRVACAGRRVRLENNAGTAHPALGRNTAADEIQFSALAIAGNAEQGNLRPVPILEVDVFCLDIGRARHQVAARALDAKQHSQVSGFTTILSGLTIAASDFKALETVAGDDVDHPGNGIGTIDRRSPVRQHFNPIDHDRGEGLHINPQSQENREWWVRPGDHSSAPGFAPSPGCESPQSLRRDRRWSRCGRYPGYRRRAT